MQEIERFKEAILKEYPRMSLEDRFSFRCHKNVPCFNHCCADVNIFLTPYDIIRLRLNLKLSSDEFLSRYTLAPFDKNLKFPVLMLKMNEDDSKTCPFVTAAGCGVYNDRPWACRMYPVGMASPKESESGGDQDFYFILREDVCHGHKEKQDWSIREWVTDQGIDEYNEMGKYFKELTLHDFFLKGGTLDLQKMEMFFMACYHLDRFRKFLFESTFFERFEIDNEEKARIKDDDVELMKFGARWIRFALFGERTIKVKPERMKPQS